MPRKLRTFSGKEVVKLLERYGFFVTRTKGSHVRLTLQTSHGAGGTVHISIPLHPTLKRGTLRGIVSELEKHIPAKDLEKYFYSQ